MKNLIILIVAFIPLSSIACRIQVPESEAQRYITASPNGVPPLYSCSDRPEEECLCVDSVEAWDEVEIITLEAKRVFSKDLNKVAAKQAIADAITLKEEKRKNFSFKGTTISVLRAELNEYLELNK